MISYDKNEIKEQLTEEQIFIILEELGGEPEYKNNCIISRTICHNGSGDGSRKLYYYFNSKLFQCFSNCGYFDIFQLVIKVRGMELNDAIQWVAAKFGIQGTYRSFEEKTQDEKIFENYERIQNIEYKQIENIELKEYSADILSRLNYNIRLTPWLEEGISQEVLDAFKIGYFLGNDQITIPHFDVNNRFIGLRGRTMCRDEADLYGKYRPVIINGLMYNHPLGMNLYNLNQSKHNISKVKKAIVYESEKSCMKQASWFGLNSDISVACCGSSITNYQIHLLKQAGAEEIIIAMDRQFQELGDEEFKHLTNNLKKLHQKYHNDVLISFMFDKEMITSYKSSPIDEGKDKFLYLFKNRIYL